MLQDTLQATGDYLFTELWAASKGSGCNLPFCLRRISTLPSASSNSLRQDEESCIPSSKSFNACSRGTFPFSSSSTIFSRRWRHSSNLGTGPKLHADIL